MAPAAAFSEVLDHCVGDHASGEPPAAGRWHPGVATRSLFWFEGAVGVTPRSSPAPSQPHTAPRLRLVHSAPPPARTLSPVQRDALDRLVALGARLDGSFTRQDLRSAFRSLARMYHPDRHPGIDAAERTRLSTEFAAARGAYDVLSRAL